MKHMIASTTNHLKVNAANRLTAKVIRQVTVNANDKLLANNTNNLILRA